MAAAVLGLGVMVYTIAGLIILALAIAGCILLCSGDEIPPPEWREPDEHADLDGPPDNTRLERRDG